MITSHLKVAAGALLALVCLGQPNGSQGQTNLTSAALRCEGAPIRLSGLRPSALPELTGRPLCVYNFTSW
jgi:hypothetical protein